MNIKKILPTFFTSLSALCLMSSCISEQTLYSWYNYEDATYQYSKKHTDELKAGVLKEYEKVIEQQKGIRKVVPPGMYAEYGFLLYRTGKQKEGLEFLKQEINLYPESEKYISRIINQLEQ